MCPTILLQNLQAIIVFSLNVDRNRIAKHARPTGIVSKDELLASQANRVCSTQSITHHDSGRDIGCGDILHGYVSLLMPTEKSTKLKLLTIFFIPLTQISDIICFILFVFLVKMNQSVALCSVA